MNIEPTSTANRSKTKQSWTQIVPESTQNNLLYASRCSKFNWRWNARKSSPKSTTNLSKTSHKYSYLTLFPAISCYFLLFPTISSYFLLFPFISYNFQLLLAISCYFQPFPAATQLQLSCNSAQLSCNSTELQNTVLKSVSCTFSVWVAPCNSLQLRALGNT